MSSEIVLLGSTLAEKYMAIKTHYNGLNQAVKIAKQLGLEGVVADLTQARQECNKQRLECEEEVLKKMPKDTNIVRIRDDWYGIKFLDGKGKSAFKDDVIKATDVELLQRNPKRENHLRYSDLDMLLPGLVDQNALEVYKMEIKRHAEAVLVEYGVDLRSTMTNSIPNDTVQQPTSNLVASTHACERYVERVVAIRGATRITDYLRSNRRPVEQDLIERAGNAEHVWTGLDGVGYYLDIDNYMYVVGDGTIITMYEEDFGFTKEINRMITLKQLEVLKQAYEHLAKAEQEHADAQSAIDRDISAIDSSIGVLNAQLDELKARKVTEASKKDHITKQLRVLREQYNAENDKLFKKWEG